MQNLHPFFVHFPLALLYAAAAAELTHLATHRPLPDALARWLLYAGAAGAAVAALSGWIARETVAPVPAAAAVLDRHQALGYVTLGAAAALALWRWATARRGGPRPRPLFAAALVGLAALLYFTSHEGGELVYEHGVGTRMTAPGGPLATPPDRAAPPAARPEVPRASDFR